MRSVLTLVLCLLSFTTTTYGQDVTPTRAYPYRRDLSEVGDKFVLFWDPDDDSIVFEIHARTQGWVGLGISREGGMIDTDVALAWVKDDGTAILQDRYSLQYDVPTLDEGQSLTLISGRRTDTHTVLVFSRPLKACDDDDVAIEHMSMRLVWAIGNDIPLDGRDPVQHRDDDRGSKTVLLLSATKTEEHILPSGSKAINLMATNVAVKQDHISVYYVILKIPDVYTKKHMIMWEPLIQPGNEDIVHHLAGYLGYQLNPNPYDEWQGWGEDIPSNFYWPKHILTWSVGGGEVWVPDNTGIAIGGPETRDNKLEYLTLEVLYHNTKGMTGRRDSSGVRLWVTETLRPTEAGLGLVGLESNFVIPPRSKEFIVNGYCASECLQQAMVTESEITASMVMLHSHYVGSKIVMRHVRNGVELPPIITEKYHDPEFQDFRKLPSPVTIRNTDQIILECTFDTTDRSGFTTGDFSLDSEMCLGIIYYTPHAAFRYCSSHLTDTQLLKFLNLALADGKVTTTGPYFGMTPTQVLSAQDWTNTAIRESFQSNTREGEMRLRCQKEYWNGSYLPAHGLTKTLSLPPNPYQEPAPTGCVEPGTADGPCMQTMGLGSFLTLLLCVFYLSSN